MKITQTRDYSRFVNDRLNRPITEKDEPRLRKLRDSMKEYGFLPFPILVRRSGDKLLVIDGQHRLTVAQQLDLPVYYVETERDDIQISKCAEAQSAWKVFDFVSSFAAQGRRSYKDLIEFSSAHRLPIMRAASILYGDAAGSGNANSHVKDGTFVIKDLGYAHRVATLVNAIGDIVPWATASNSINALSRFIRVEEFSDEQLMKKAGAHPHLLRKQPTLELFSEMYEEVYNHASRTKIPLAFLAREAAQKRQDVGLKKRKAA